MNKLSCVMLIDDNEYDNYFHKRTIEKSGKVETVIVMQSAEEALKYLSQSPETNPPRPELLFLDINMPGMNGWEFLEEYKKLGQEQQVKTLIVMLTTARNKEHREKAKSIMPNVGFFSKPLTTDVLSEIILKHFIES